MRTFLACFAITVAACGPQKERVSFPDAPPRQQVKGSPRVATSAPRSAELEAGAVPSGSTLAPLNVGGNVKAPVAISRTEPKLPENLRITPGPIFLEAIIDRTGVPREVKVIRDGCRPPLGGFYADAIKRWRFKPATLNGKPVDVRFTLSVIVDVRR